MKKITLCIFVMTITQLTFSQSIKDFKWLEGTWERKNVKPGTTAFELWEKTKDGYEGIGVSMKGSDTTFVEKLKIVKQDGDMYYVANVSTNDEPTYFKIISISENGFVSENPEHDFPKKIEYILEGTRMTAIISAGDNKMGFEFEKVD